MHENIKKILKAIRTKEDLNLLLQAVEEAQRNTYRMGVHNLSGVLEKWLPERLAHPVEEAWLDYLGGSQPHTPGEFIDNLKLEFKKLRVLKLYLAWEPSTETLERIENWIKKEVGEDMILEIELDPAILGGAKMAFAGKFREITLYQLIDNYFQEQRSHILTEVRG